MTPALSLEDLLPAALDRLADELQQPLAPDARSTIRRRAEALRRRRRAQRAVAMGAIAAATVAVGMWLRVGDAVVQTAPEATTQPEPVLPKGDGRLPRITVRNDLLQEVWRSDVVDGRTSQFFDQTDHVKRPTVKVLYGKTESIALPFTPGVPLEPVDVGGVPAQLQTGPTSTLLAWNPTADTTILVDARRLSRDDLLRFARGLHPRAVGEGVEARVLPAELGEYTAHPRQEHREILLSPPNRPAIQAQVITEAGGQDEYESLVRGLSSDADRVRKIRVLGREAFAIDRRGGRERMVIWRHTTDSVIWFDLWAANNKTFDQLTSDLTELSEDEWQQLGQAVDAQPAR